MKKIVLSGFLGKTAFNKLNKTVYGSFLIGAVGNDPDLRTSNDTQRKDAEKRFGVHAAFFLFDPDRGLELISFLDEKCSGTGVQTYLILNHYIFNEHNTLS